MPQPCPYCGSSSVLHPVDADACAMHHQAYPSNDRMAEELLACGWTQERIGHWKAPNGARYLGPFQAWKAMNGILLREGVFGDHRS